jgi:hypothetical protein
MHYRAGPGQRPIHTLEAVSDLPRGVVAAALMTLAASASVVMLGRIGADLYCTRNQDGPRCVVHQHFVGHTTAVRAAGASIDRDQRRTSIEVRGLHHGEGARAAFEVSVPTEPLVFDARFYRDSIDAPLRRGRWLTGRAAFEEASLQFHDGGSPGYFVRERSGLAPVTVGASLSLAGFSAAILAFLSARRRRFRLVFDPNTETARLARDALQARARARGEALDRRRADRSSRWRRRGAAQRRAALVGLVRRVRIRPARLSASRHGGTAKP